MRYLIQRNNYLMPMFHFKYLYLFLYYLKQQERINRVLFSNYDDEEDTDGNEMKNNDLEDIGRSVKELKKKSNISVNDSRFNSIFGRSP